MPTTVKLVGGAPNQVPRNKDLGNLAYQNAESIAGPVGIGGPLTLSQGAINGVTYLNANKVLTAGSALTFDGTNLSIGTNSPSAKLSVYHATNTDPTLTANAFAPVSLNNAGVELTYGVYTSSPFAAWLQTKAGGASWPLVINPLGGNLGLGVNPSAWGSGVSGFQVGSWASLSSANAYGTGIGFNNFYNGTNHIYSFSNGASKLELGSGTFKFLIAPSGTAGAAITFTQAMTLDANGNLLVGVTSPSNAAKQTLGFKGTLNNAFSINDTEGTVTSAGYLFFSRSGIPKGSIAYSEAAGLVSYNTTSDYRAKDITGPVNDSGTLIDSVPVYMGKMKGSTQERPMFIAHETPEYARTGEKDAVDAEGNPVYQQMDASALIPVMWAEIQSLRQRLAAAGI